MNDTQKLIIEKRAELRKFRFGTSGSNVKNVKLAKNLKKEIARAMTKLKAEKK